MPFTLYNGYQIISSQYMTEKKLKRMCRSKKKRIIKKWLKNPKNYIKKPMSKLIINEVHHIIVCHPKIAQKIIHAIGQKNSQPINLYQKEGAYIN